MATMWERRQHASTRPLCFMEHHRLKIQDKVKQLTGSAVRTNPMAFIQPITLSRGICVALQDRRLCSIVFDCDFPQRSISGQDNCSGIALSVFRLLQLIILIYELCNFFSVNKHFNTHPSTYSDLKHRYQLGGRPVIHAASILLNRGSPLG